MHQDNNNSEIQVNIDMVDNSKNTLQEMEKAKVHQAKQRAESIIGEAETRARKRLAAYEQKGQEIIHEAEEEAERIRLIAEKEADHIINKAKLSALKRIDTLTKEAEVKAREKGVEIMAKVVEQTQYKAISVARDMALNHAEEIIKEAEERAKQIIEKAQRMAKYVGEGTPESKRSQTHRNRSQRLF